MSDKGGPLNGAGALSMHFRLIWTGTLGLFKSPGAD